MDRGGRALHDFAFRVYVLPGRRGQRHPCLLFARPAAIGSPEILASATVNATTGPLPIQQYISGELERTLIDAGIWEFKTYASVSSSNAARIITEIYQRTVGGAETFLFAGTRPNVSSPTPTAATGDLRSGQNVV